MEWIALLAVIIAVPTAIESALHVCDIIRDRIRRK